MAGPLTLDFEVRSAVSLKSASYRRYASDPTTRVLCLACQEWDEECPTVYRPVEGAVFPDHQPCPPHILRAIESGVPIYAHNVQFDRRVYEWHCVNTLGWPEIPFDQWRCSMALCSCYGLPRKLEKACAALGLKFQKDMKGHRIMMQLIKPKKPTKPFIAKCLEEGYSLDNLPLMWEENPEKLEANANYCMVDVLAQTCLLQTLGEIPADRLREWQMDQRINERGVPVDVESLLKTQRWIDTELKAVDVAIQEATDGEVASVGQVGKIKEWAERQGVMLPDVAKDTVETFLSRTDLPPQVLRVLELRGMAGKASIKKCQALINNVDDDGRARDSMVYHKASTGRFAGRAWQPHNFPRNAMPDEQAMVFHAVMHLSEDPITMLCGDNRWEYFDMVSQAMRSYLQASAGRRLMISDFSSIESRGLAWLAGCETMLQAYRRKECVYSQFASRVYGREIKTKGEERTLGKVAVLGLGYQMGAEKFIETAAGTPGVPDLGEKQWAMKWDWEKKCETPQEVTKGWYIMNLYRTTYPEIPQFWKDALACMMEAVQECKVVRLRNMAFGREGKWAWIQLPSGRCIWYREPKVSLEISKFRPEGKRQRTLSAMTLDSVSQKWVRRHMYGGLIVENIVQGVCADLLMNAMQTVESHPLYDVLLTVHDEIVAETERGSEEEFHQLMLQSPQWADGFPVDAETKGALRYGK
jgi:DNA polymerase